MSTVDPLDPTNPTYADKVKQLVDEIKALKTSITSRLTTKVTAPVAGLVIPSMAGKALSTLTVAGDETTLVWGTPNSFMLPPPVANSVIVYNATGTALETRTFSAIGSNVVGNLNVTGNTTTVGLTSTGPVVIPAATLGAHAMQKQQAEALSGRLVKIQRFLAYGTFTYTKTAGVTRQLFKVQAGSAGGSGAPATSSTQVSVGFPGQSGAYGELFTGSDYNGCTIVVGRGGDGGVGAAGEAGGDSSVTNGAGKGLTCEGGRATSVSVVTIASAPIAVYPASPIYPTPLPNPGPGDVFPSAPSSSRTLDPAFINSATVISIPGTPSSAQSGQPAPITFSTGPQTAGISAYGLSYAGTGTINRASQPAMTGGTGAQGFVEVWEYT